jgi:hypothetical protein
MRKKSLVAVAAFGIAATIAIPTIAFGNARSNLGSLSFMRVANTPFTAQLFGANEVPAADPDGFGSASVTFDIINAAAPGNGAEVCWDLSYGNILTPPVQAHIHSGAAGTNGAIVIPFTPFTGLGASSATGCARIDPTLAQQIMDTPANFYVNIHTTDFTGGAIRGQLGAGPPPAGEAHLLTEPLRAYDSRDNAGPKINANETRTISLATGKNALGASVIALPPGATGAIVTLTVTETNGTSSSGGFLKVYTAALANAPATSSINWTGANQNLAVSTQVAVDGTRSVKVTGGANATHFVIDVIGYLF